MRLFFAVWPPPATAHALPVEQAQYWKHRRIVWAGPREMPAALATLAGAGGHVGDREGHPSTDN